MTPFYGYGSPAQNCSTTIIRQLIFKQHVPEIPSTLFTVLGSVKD